MTFERPELLYAGAAVVVLVVLGMWRHAVRRRRLAEFLGGRRAVERLSRSDLYRLRIERIAVAGIAAAALGLAAAGPAWLEPDTDVPLPPPRRDFVIALDVSASMQAVDGAPTRLAEAVAVARRLIEGADGEHIGLLLFAGEAYPIVPPTPDHAVLDFLLDGVTATIASAQDPGTRLSVAIEAAVQSLAAGGAADAPGADPAVVLVTDGEVGETSEAVAAAIAEAVDGGVVVHFVSVGGEAGAPMTMPRAQYQLGGPVLGSDGAPALSRARPSLLRDLAASGDGRFAVAGDDPSIDALAAALRRPVEVADRPPQTEPGRPDPVSVLVAIALAALVVEGLLDVRPPAPIRAMRRGAA